MSAMVTDETTAGARHGRDPLRLLPTIPRERDIALELVESVAAAPIISPHGHVPASMLRDDQPFPDPTELLVTPDHYLTRLLHADGVDLAELGVGGGSVDPRAAWRLVAQRWKLFAGTATGYWMAEALAGVFGIDETLSARTADDIYDRISGQLATEEFRPKVLFRRFGIDTLATTDDPMDTLDAHRELQEQGFRVLPTFRPDRYLDPEAPDFTASVERMLGAAGVEGTFAGYLDALQQRRAHFVAHGAVSSDHGVLEPRTAELGSAEAEVLFQRALSGKSTSADAALFRAHMLLQMAGMSVDDGLTMTVHPGVFRNHSSATLRRYGADTGHDIPVATSFVDGLRPLLERFGLHPGFRLILFTVDETTYSREIAPLAGFYPSVYIGSPWWFLDAPDAIMRFRSAVTETAGFYRGSGFVDDTRAFLSIPARHDTARRVDASFLARLVTQSRIDFEQAAQIMQDSVEAIPRRAFKL